MVRAVEIVEVTRSRRQAVLPEDEDVRDCNEKRVKDKSGVPQQFVDDLLVEVVPVKNAELTAERANIFDDVPGASLTQRELILGASLALTIRTNASTTNE
ncbi:hypothetical protein HX613_02285 [Brevibacterium sp. UCMA 11754]|nr:hypothetical protein [Brevibacterium sp. UCMA 11754]